MKALQFMKCGILTLAIAVVSSTAFGQVNVTLPPAKKPTQNEVQLRESVAQYFALLGVSCTPNCPVSSVDLVKAHLKHLSSVLVTASQEDRLFYVLEILKHFLAKPLMSQADTVTEAAPSDIKFLLAKRILKTLSRHQQIRFVFPFEGQNIVIDSKTVSKIDELLSNSKIIGTYSCNNSLITVDLNRGPADIAAIVLHELNHYFLDRKLDVQKKNMGDLFSAMLLEEIYSSIYGSIHQRQLAQASVQKNLLITLSDEGIDFRLTNLKSKKSAAGVVFANLAKNSYGFESNVSDDIARVLTDTDLEWKLFKRFERFYFPKTRVPLRTPPGNHNSYLVVSGILFRPDLLRLNRADFEREIQVQKRSSVRCDDFTDARDLLGASGYPGIRSGGESGKTGGESGKTGGDSGKTAGSVKRLGGESGKTGGDSGKTELDLVFPCLEHRMIHER